MNDNIRRMVIHRSLDRDREDMPYYSDNGHDEMRHYSDYHDGNYRTRGYDGRRGGTRRVTMRTRRDGRYYDEYEMPWNRASRRSYRHDYGYPYYDRGEYDDMNENEAIPAVMGTTIVYENGYCEPEYTYDYGRSYARHYPRYDYGRYDYGEDDMRLTKRDMQEWKQKMINADGSQGEHFSMERIIPMAQQLGIHFDDFTQKEFCMVVNMLYSDNANVTKKYIAPDKELMYYVEMARAWLEDDDAPEGSEKLARYYHDVVNADD